MHSITAHFTFTLVLFSLSTGFIKFSLIHIIYGAKYSRMEQVRFLEDRQPFKNVTWFMPEYFDPFLVRLFLLHMAMNTLYFYTVTDH